jgi:hypothetical protein
MPVSSTVNVMGEIPFPFPSSDVETNVKILIPDFQFEFSSPIVDVAVVKEQNSFEVKTKLVDGAFLIFNLSGEFDKCEDRFQIRQIRISHELTDNQALSEFVALTYRAMLSLASEVSIKLPEFELDLITSFDFPLKEISYILQSRQTAYRVMVIENALGIKLPIPPEYISGEDVEWIAYAYYSIVERSFDWIHVPTLYPMPAIQDVLSWFPKSKDVLPFEFVPNQVIKQIFGNDINLGHQKTIIENAVIENYEEAKQELEKLDGHIVNVCIRSLSGLIKVESIDTPRLPENPWELRIQQLIDLDSQLDAEMVRRYCELAASTLDGLSDEMKIAVTTYPELDNMFFSVED